MTLGVVVGKFRELRTNLLCCVFEQASALMARVASVYPHEVAGNPAIGLGNPTSCAPQVVELDMETVNPNKRGRSPQLSSESDQAPRLDLTCFIEGGGR